MAAKVGPLAATRVFLSGPMTGRDTWNVAEFAKAHAMLAGLGAERVYDPALEWYEDMAVGREVTDHETCMLRTLGELTMTLPGGNGPYYDLVVMLPGWENSDGARLECEVAEACGIPVVNLGDLA